jgi:hypothetical protein
MQGKRVWFLPCWIYPICFLLLTKRVYVGAGSGLLQQQETVIGVFPFFHFWNSPRAKTFWPRGFWNLEFRFAAGCCSSQGGLKGLVWGGSFNLSGFLLNESSRVVFQFFFAG